MTTTADQDLYGDEHIRVYRETGGERGFHWRNGTTILLLETKGATTGEDRTSALIFREDDGRYVIVASKGGAPEHPAWYHNIKAHPGDVRVQVRDRVMPVRARDAEGEERERLWRLMAEVWPDYDAYQEKTDREIPVVVLEPAQ